jgi:putative drug exporter of the RND superfamily
MFHSLGRFSCAYAWAIACGWLLTSLVLALLAPAWDTRTQDDDVRFIPERFTSVRAHQLMEKAFPRDVCASNLVLAVERAAGALDAADFDFVDRLVQQLDRLRQEAPELKIGNVVCYQDGILGARLTSIDQRCTLIQVPLGTPYLAVATQTAVERAQAVVRRCSASARPGLQVFATGAAAVGHDVNKVCEESFDSTSWATVILVVVVLLAVYRAPLLALVPLLPIGFSVWVSLNLLALLTLVPGVHLVNISKLFAIVILYGAGTDYSLFLISRYKEELELGSPARDALERSVGGVGAALAASAGTVMVGLGLMALAEFAKVRYTGPAIALSLGVALVASLTLTPALLYLLGRRVFWPGHGPTGLCPARLALRQLGPARRCPWEWVSRLVARRPLAVWSAAAALLLPLMVVGMRVQPNYRATGELSPEAESLRGLAAIQRHYTAGEIGPITVLLHSAKDWTSREGLVEIERLSRGFARLPGIAEVRSLTQPLGMASFELPPAPAEEGLWRELLLFVQPYLDALRQQMLAGARDIYTARIEADPNTAGATQPRYVTRLDVVLATDPFEPESVEALELIQTWLREDLPRYSVLGGDLGAECFGVTANARDLAEVTEGDRLRVNSLVLVAIFAILLALVRRFWLALYMLATVLISYYAALGATVLAGVFWTGQPQTSLDWRVPFFLFTILVAVGEDYNILLVSRALEESKRHGLVEGMRRAVACTGGAITSCGLIMAGTFATLMLTGLNALMHIGFALAFGVLIDTFIVRPFLVPALTIYWWGQAGQGQGASEPRPSDALVPEEPVGRAA